MKIYINANGPDFEGGYFTYIINLLKNLSHIDKKNYYIVRSNGKIHENLSDLNSNFKRVKSSKLFNSSIIRFLWMQIFLPFFLVIKKVDVLFSPLNTSPFILKFLKIKSIIVIHSNLPWIDNKLLPYGINKAKFIQYLKNLSLRCSDKIICVSETAKKELIINNITDKKKYESILLGINKKKINFIPNYSSKYLLYVANSALHHNHINLLKAFKQFVEFYSKDYKLCLVMNPVDINNDKFLRMTIKENNLLNYVNIQSFVNHNSLFKLYANSSLYVFPSLVETFGLTTLEAMSVGTPVVCSDISAMPEVNKDAAIYFNPYDHNDILNKIKLVIENSQIRSDLIKRGMVRVKELSWTNTAMKTLKVLIRD